MPSKFSVVWTETADKDLESIIEYIAEDSISGALGILTKIKKKCSDLSSFPARGRIIPELKEFNILQYHELIIDHWRIIYKISNKQVTVLSVIDSRRNIEDILLDRFIINS